MLKGESSYERCPYLLFSANVVPPKSSTDASSYAQVVKVPENKVQFNGSPARTAEHQQVLQLLVAKKEKREKAQMDKMRRK